VAGRTIDNRHESPPAEAKVISSTARPGSGPSALDLDRSSRSALKEPQAVEQVVEVQRTYRRIGYWAAVVCGVDAVAYGLVSILVGVLAPWALTWERYEQFVADYQLWPTMAVLVPPLAVTIAFPLLVVAVYATVSELRRPWALSALLFAGSYTAVLGAAYWLQVTTVPWNILRGVTEASRRGWLEPGQLLLEPGNLRILRHGRRMRVRASRSSPACCHTGCVAGCSRWVRWASSSSPRPSTTSSSTRATPSPHG
jgi:hypothetical protein